MDERTHSWIAIRAIALLEDKQEAPNLVKLLKPAMKKASVGAWIPDQTDAKRGDAGSKTENHVLKIEPYKFAAQRDRFTLCKNNLLELIGMYRTIAQYLQQDQTLDDKWWGSPYKADIPKAGQHLPNRVMALSTMLKDLLLMGNQRIDQLTSQNGKYKQFMKPEVCTKEEAAAMYFFTLSHFVADICMPCHCDARLLSGYGAGLHKELEAHWSKIVGTGFEKKNLAEKGTNNDKLLQQARTIDAKFNLQFAQGEIPSLHPEQDEWSEAMYLCRASFAIASIIAPYTIYNYDNNQPHAPFEVVFGNGNEPLLAEMDAVLIHDAILNTAIFWKHLWDEISKN